MKNIIIDTNGYAAFKNGNEDAVEIIRIAEQIGVCAIVLGELLAGFIIGSREQKNRKELSDFLRSPRVSILVADNETAEYYARIFSKLKQKGQPIPTNDLWIGAIAMQHGYGVFTFDKHFGSIDNLLTCNSPMQLLP